MPTLNLTKEAHVAHSPVGLPVDEATRPELVDFGSKLLRSENVRQGQRGASAKRDGFAAMTTARSDASTSTAGYKMFAKRKQLLRVTDTLQLETFSPTANAWQATGPVPEAGVTTTGLATLMSAATLSPESLVRASGYLFLKTGSTSRLATDGTIGIYDASNLALVVESGGWQRGLLTSLGQYAMMVYDAATNGLTVESFDMSSGVLATNSALAATDFSGGTGSTYAVCALSDRVALVYVNNSGGTSRLTVKTFNMSGGAPNLIGSTTINTTSVTPDAVDIGCFQGTGTLYVAWNEGSAVKMIGYSPTNLATVNATTGTILTGSNAMNLINISPSTATQGRLWCNSQLNVRAHTIGYQTNAGAAAQLGTAVTLSSVAAVSKPVFYNGRHYIFVHAGGSSTLPSLGNTQNVQVLIDWTGPFASFYRPVANLFPGTAQTGTLGKMDILPGATTGLFYSAMGVVRSRAATGSVLVTIDFNDTSRWQPVSHAGTVFLSGALPSYFDNNRTAEVGFMVRPVWSGSSFTATGLTGTYRYVGVWEEVDGDGNWCVSGVSDPSSVISPANQTVTTTWYPLSVTARTGPPGTLTTNVRLAVYRTITGGNPPYFRAGTVANDSTQATLSFVDNIPDTTLSANAQLYEQPSIQGTAQDRRPPPPFQAIVSYNGMLVGASGSDIWYSGQNVGGEGVWFNPIFQVPIPGDGDITALAVMDGALFVFKRRDIFVLGGDPPSDNGASGGLGAPRRLSTDIGCIEPRSTCATTLGVFFQSDRGIEILNRGQTVDWIGEPYTATLAANPVCTSITVEPVSNTVLVELAASQASGAVSGTGCTLVYDLSLKQWVSKDIRLTSGVPSQSSCMTSAGVYAWMSNTGVVYNTTPGTSLDAGAWVTALIETGNARHGLQQRQRIWGAMVLFQRADAAGLQVEIAYDYAGYTDTKTWTETETLSQQQLECRPQSEHAAIRFRISDTAPAALGTGKGFTFIGLSLDMAQKQGPTKGTPHLNPALRK